jgi:hypothetical protein
MTTCSDPLPDFTKFQYVIVTPPKRPKGKGWEKLKECERRQVLIQFLIQGYRRLSRIRASAVVNHQLTFTACSLRRSSHAAIAFRRVSSSRIR